MTVGTSLRRSDEWDWYCGALGVIGDGVITTAADGKVLHLNPVAESLVGVSQAHAAGRPLAEVLHFLDAEAGEAVADPFSACTGRDASQPIQVTLVRDDGMRFAVTCCGTFIRGAAGEDLGAVISLRDRTGEVAAQRELAKSEGRYAALMRQSVVGVAQVDPSSGRFLEANDRYCEILGLTRKEVLATAFQDITHPGDLPADLDRLRRLVDGKIREYSAEKRYLRKDGSIAWVSLWATPVWAPGEPPGCIIAVAKDISARKLAEAALEARTRELQLMLDHMINAFIVWESVLDDEGNFVSFKFGYFNEAYARIAKVTQEVRGKDVFVVWPTTERSWVDVYAEVAVTGEPKTFEMYHDPTKGWYHCNAYRPTDSPARVCVIFEDITDQKKNEEKARLVNVRLEERVKERTAELETAIQELESFSYSVSHDLRGPLRAIDGFVHMLQEDYGGTLDEEGLHHCESISGNARRMGQLIDDLLAFSRLGRAAVNKCEIDMRSMAKAVFDGLVVPFGENRVKLKLGSLGPAVGDPALLRQVWENLISNALKYTSKNEAALVEIAAESRDGEKVFYVRDNGVGFDMQYVDKLFGVFQRLHGATEFEGSGVGLAIVQRLVVRHGGRVWAEGQVGKGATFYFALPA
jgi:PAS domain S-box-containing protein